MQRPEFGLYRTPEGWAIWAVFPFDSFFESDQPLIEFNCWCADRGITFDVARGSDQYWNSERGAIVKDEILAMEFKMRWVTHKVEYVFT